jgi:hypothetical protein
MNVKAKVKARTKVQPKRSCWKRNGRLTSIPCSRAQVEAVSRFPVRRRYSVISRSSLVSVNLLNKQRNGVNNKTSEIDCQVCEEEDIEIPAYLR